jgi:arylsulfatase A-like enzyme
LKLSENTLVVFTSDNGGVGGYVREGIARKKDEPTDNAPLRSGKGSLYEGGVRVAWMARWPGKIPAGVCDVPIIGVDLYPTLMELGGGKAPAGQPLDGVSLVSLMTSGGKSAPEREAIYWHFPGYLGAGQANWRTTPAGAIRAGDWKLHEFFEDGRIELYNLRDDLSQKTNLAERMPEKVKELHGKLVAWRKAVGAPMPTRNVARK